MKSYFSSYGNPVNDQQVLDYLKENSLVLPIEYIHFLLEVNGGTTQNKSFELGKFDIENKRLDCYVDIDKFFSLEELESAWTYLKEELDEHKLFPIAEVRGGMIVCCKQATTQNAEIYYFDFHYGATKLTDSLNDFFELLIPEADVDYKKYGIDY